MKYITRIFFKGLVAALPAALTIYLVYWLGRSIESLIKPIIITLILPANYYWPGMGLVAGVLLIFGIGVLMEAYIVSKLFSLGEAFLERVPVVKSIYGGLRDFLEYFTRFLNNKNMRRVVIVSFGETRLMGFVTSEWNDSGQSDSDADNLVAVYLPMSYQIGGFTVHVPEKMVKPYDISVEDAMRKILTAGLSQNKRKPS